MIAKRNTNGMVFLSHIDGDNGAKKYVTYFIHTYCAVLSCRRRTFTQYENKLFICLSPMGGPPTRNDPFTIIIL